MRMHARNSLQRVNIKAPQTSAVILRESRLGGTSRRTCICFSAPGAKGAIFVGCEPLTANSTMSSPPTDAINSFGVPTRDHFAVIHNRHAIAQPLRFLHIMRRQNDRSARLLQLLHQIPHVSPRLRIEPRRRLIQKQQLRIAHQRTWPSPAAASARRSARPRATAASLRAAPA